MVFRSGRGGLTRLMMREVHSGGGMREGEVGEGERVCETLQGMNINTCRNANWITSVRHESNMEPRQSEVKKGGQGDSPR